MNESIESKTRFVRYLTGNAIRESLSDACDQRDTVATASQATDAMKVAVWYALARTLETINKL